MRWILIIIWAFVPLIQENYWDILADVRLETREVDGYEMDYPVFGEKVSAIEGKSIRLRGYMIPLEDMLGSQYFILSALPFNSCFFCGGAGPETIVEVFTNKEIEFTSDIIVVQGDLVLNDDDPDHHMYMMKNANITKE